MIPDTTHNDPRRAAILTAAFETFARYGFRRTAMEDIARACNLSRASLYLHFQNKQDILRALTAYYFDVTETRMRAALQPGQKPKHALTAAFAAKLGPEVLALLDSPHGADILNAETSSAPDLIAQGEARLIAALSDWLRIEAAYQRITLNPLGVDAPTLAQTMLAALKGLMAQAQDSDMLRARAQALALLFARGLKP